MEKNSDAYYVSVEQLDVGVYVQLDLRWVEHNFSLNSFKIKNADQIAELKTLGLKKIRIDPARSAVVPPPYQDEAETSESSVPVDSILAKTARPVQTAPPINQERHEFIQQQRAALTKCERQFAKAASSLKDINANIHARPQEAVAEASHLVQDILTTILSDKDVAIHLMSDKFNGDEMYYHALNVSVLAMILAKELRLPASDIKELGIGCLFHDIGKIQIPDRVLKNEHPTRAEFHLLKEHCAYGVSIGAKAGLSQQALDVILQHHEYADGSGYPNLLTCDEISPLARIAAIVNTYDNLCNPLNPATALTPYEALSHMYANERKRLDSNFLSIFVRCMGVYPPGTLVRLSDETLGLVVAANFGMPLRPRILIFDPSIPKDEATVLDLQKAPDLSVKSSLRPTEIAREVYDYLSPRTHMAYFFDVPSRNARS